MKRFFYLILLSLCFLPVNVKALDATITMNCSPNELKKGEEFVCDVNLQADENIKKVEALITLGDNLVEFSTTPTNYLTTGNQLIIEDTSSTGLSTTSPITTIYLKIKDAAAESIGTEPNVIINLTNLRVVTANNEEKTLEPLAKGVRILSTNNSLTGLSVDGSNITLTTAVSYSYTLNSDKSSININWTKGHPKQIVTMSYKGNNLSSSTVSNLDYGNNTIIITVHPEDGTDKIYTLTVTRPDNRSTINTISNLKVKDESKTYTINFSPTTTSYTINVASNISSVTISATLTDEKASFVTNYSPGVKSVEYGKNTYYLKVKPEKGDIKTYTIVINRPDNRSSNAYLKSLKLDYGNLTFDKNVLEYTLTVPYTVTSINIEKETEDSKSKVEVIGESDLDVGENIIKIKVTAENGDTKEYKITITRQEKEAPPPSNNTYLSKLIIANYDLQFNKDIYSYDLTIDSKDKSLSITTATEDTKANYRILNNENLTNDSQIKIRVTAEDGSTKDYILNITIKNTLDIALLIAIIALSVGIIILVIVIILKNKTKRKYKNKKIINSDNLSQQETVPLLDDENDNFETQKIIFTSKKDV